MEEFDSADLRAQAAKSYDPAVLRDALDRILKWHEQHKTPVASVLRKGLTKEEIHKATEWLGFSLPDEVVTLYEWRNGMKAGTDAPFIWYHDFMSLEAIRDEYRKLTVTWPFYDWSNNWLPLFQFEGEYYFVACTKEPSPALPVRFHMSEETEHPAVYTSLTSMMLTAAECFESGAVTLANKDGALKEDIRKIAEIHRKHNPGLPFNYAVP
jgi:cell wall assembly regulator SMI1